MELGRIYFFIRIDSVIAKNVSVYANNPFVLISFQHHSFIFDFHFMWKILLILISLL